VNQGIHILQGTLDMVILKAVSLGALHGYGILLRIQQISGDSLQIQQGSLYPALYRLVSKGFIKSKWGTSENGRRSRFYELTPSGRKQLQAEAHYWQQMTTAIGTALKAAPQQA
jgi:PadR family transcriptional regulator, regulatory protein PadR